MFAFHRFCLMMKNEVKFEKEHFQCSTFSAPKSFPQTHNKTGQQLTIYWQGIFDFFFILSNFQISFLIVKLVFVCRWFSRETNFGAFALKTNFYELKVLFKALKHVFPHFLFSSTTMKWKFFVFLFGENKTKKKGIEES